MRARSILLVIAILLVAGFAAMNWAEIVRPSSLWVGPVIMDAPLGAILLGLLALTLVLFLASTAAMRTQSLIDYRQHHKTLEAQRELADKAEASRFTDLRQHLDTRLRELHERDKVSATEMEKVRLEQQREIRTQLEQMNRMLSARLNELEHRLEARLERAGHGGGPVAVTPAVPARPVVPAQHGPLERQEPVLARHDVHDQQARDAQAHQAQMREEERMRDERIREEREARAQADRPAESGWRRWF